MPIISAPRLAVSALLRTVPCERWWAITKARELAGVYSGKEMEEVLDILEALLRVARPGRFVDDTEARRLEDIARDEEIAEWEAAEVLEWEEGG